MYSNKLTTTEIFFIAILGACMGVCWWGYSLFADILNPVLKLIACDGILTGAWLMGGIFFAYVIRKPGSALLGELAAAIVQGFISKWGISSVIYGLAQGLPVELFFLAIGYKRWSLGWLSGACFLSALSSYLLTFFWYQYYKMDVFFNVMECSCVFISAFLFAGIGNQYIADRLAKTGVLNSFRIITDAFKK